MRPNARALVHRVHRAHRAGGTLTARIPPMAVGRIFGLCFPVTCLCSEMLLPRHGGNSKDGERKLITTGSAVSWLTFPSDMKREHSVGYSMHGMCLRSVQLHMPFFLWPRPRVSCSSYGTQDKRLGIKVQSCPVLR